MRVYLCKNDDYIHRASLLPTRGREYKKGVKEEEEIMVKSAKILYCSYV